MTASAQRFELFAPLGRGAMGAVWDARVSGVDVALKTLTRAGCERPTLWRALEAEVRAMARLDHSGIVRVYDYGALPDGVVAPGGEPIPAGSPYLVLERVSGGRLRRSSIRSWGAAHALLVQLLRALAHAHGRGVVHRDLKPGNVLLEGQVPKLGDFGLAAAHDRATREGSDDAIVGGTPGFMAPEQILARHRDEGPWTDLYAVGCLAFAICSGVPPLRGETAEETMRRHCFDDPPALRARYPVPDGLDAWVRAMMAKSPHARFRFAADALHALERVHLGWVAGEEGAGLTPGADAGAAPLDDDDDPTVLAETLAHGWRGSDEPGSSWSSWRSSSTAALAGPTPRAVDDRPRPGGLGLGTFGLRTVPLSGRGSEQALLWERLRTCAAEARPHLVVVAGPSGLGKSRLVAWLAEAAQERGAATVLWAGHGREPHPMDGLAGLLHAHFRSHGEDPEELERRLGESPWLRALGPVERAQILDVLVPGTPGTRAAPRDRFASVRALLREIATERPLVVVLDDLPRSAESVAFVEQLMRAEPDEPAPLLVVATAQTEDPAELEDVGPRLDALCAGERATRLELTALEPEAHRHLVQELLGFDSVLADRISERTLGSPLFAIQLVGDLVQRGALRPTGRGFALRPGDELTLPADVHQLWEARLSRIAESLAPADALYEALYIAAVLGREVERVEWEDACAGAGLTIHPSLLDELAKRRLAQVDAERFVLEHGMLVDSLRRRAREHGAWARAHRAAADALARRGRAADAERVGRHFLEAGEPRSAIAPLLEAASQRYHRSEREAAIAVLELRDGALDALGVDAGDPLRAEAALLRAGVEIRVGRADDAEAVLAASAGACERAGPEPHARWLWMWGRMQNLRWRYEEAITQLVAGLAISEAAALPETTACLRQGLSSALIGVGEFDAAEREARLSIELFEQLGDAAPVPYSWSNVAAVRRARGDHDGAAEAGRRMREAALRHGNRHAVGVSNNIVGDCARYQGRLDEARRAYEAADREFAAVAAERDVRIVRINLGLVLIECGEHAAAEVFLRGTQEFFAGGPIEVALRAGLVVTAASDGRWVEHDEHFAVVESRWETLGGDRDEAARPLEIAAELCERAGEAERARRCWSLARRLWRSLDRAADVAAIDARLGDA